MKKMAGNNGGGGEGFWLPSEFLGDEDFLVDKQNFSNTESDSEFCFPTEFPYDCPTQSEKLWLASTSPQSTLAHFGSAGGSSPNAVPSPPTTPLGAKNDAVGDLICLAAGQVAKLKLNRGYVDNRLFAPPQSHAQFHPQPKTPIPSVYLDTHFQQKRQNESYEVLYSRQQMCQNRGGMGQAAWPVQHHLSRGRAVSFGVSGGGGGGGAAAKRACAGTGVFLPRRYDNVSNSNAYSSEFNRKPGRAAVQVHTKHFHTMSGFAQSQPHPLPRINGGFISDYDLLLARRRALLLQQQRRLLASLADGSSVIGRDLYLP